MPATITSVSLTDSDEEPMGTDTPTPISTTPRASSLGSPPNPELSPRLAPAPCATTEPPTDNALVYPDPTPDPDVKPKVKPTDNSPAKDPTPLTTANPRSLQTPEASVPPQG
uniref:Uncharacterized protein n=1 Tax=Moniliophthora roreri TaxID=221103 RepID=A0A0W0FD92_MONRR